MKYKSTYGEAAKKHAVNLRIRGRFSYAEIEKETGIPEGYVRKLVSEEKSKSVTPENVTVAENVQAVTLENSAGTDVVTPEKQAENTEKTQEMTKERVTGKGFFSRHFSRMDAVFYIATVTACYSFFYIAPGIPGIAFALLYWLLAFDALQRCKAVTENPALAQSAQNRVWGLEAFAFVAHWNLINEYLWQNLEKLPFEVTAKPDGGTWILDFDGTKTNIVWENGQYVSVVAAILAASVCAAVIVAVGTTFQTNKNPKP